MATLPEQIDAQERAREALYGLLANPALARDGPGHVRAKARLAELDASIVTVTERWEAHETIATEEG